MPDADAAPLAPYLLARDEGEAVWFLGSLMTVKATGATTRGAFGLIEQELSPGFATPLHVHHGEDEPFYILEGEITFRCGERTMVAGPGAFVFLPKGIVHGFTVTSETPARLLQFNFPAGIEHFFVEAGEPAPARTLPPPGPPKLDKVLALAERYRFEIVGPPPSH
ncbi:MAG: quercetin 2,3-dioxygenase [Thermomicrobiales bacterium]